MMKYFVFRTATIEYCIDRFANLSGASASYSGYQDISFIDQDASRYLWWYTMPIKAQIDLTANEIMNYSSQFSYIVSRIDRQKMIVAITIEPGFMINSITSNRSIVEAIEQYNNTLRSIAAEHSNVKVVEFSKFTTKFPIDQLMDWKYYFISQTPINPKLSQEFALWLNREVRAIDLNRKKCLVLDLDNTLWGGIVGEDGVHGIKIGGAYPGNAYELFQQYILELQKQGVILALCSKNNLNDIEQVWEQNTNNLIHKEHLAAWRINWQDKATNLKELATELNIGLDSMVFVDDNPSERELVKAMLPSVAVPDFVNHPYELPQLIQKIADDHFSIYTLTDEDLAKTAQYKANALRSCLASTFDSIDQYIASLEIKLAIKVVDHSTIERAAQLTQKTNQFNFTTKRYTTTDIESIIKSGALCYTLGVTDKFGDSGITGLIMLTKQEDDRSYHIDTFLLSCRILGKGIESEFLSKVIGKLKNMGVKRLTAQYIVSPKNDQVADFYAKFGFDEKQNKCYQLDLSIFEIKHTDKYTIL